MSSEVLSVALKKLSRRSYSLRELKSYLQEKAFSLLEIEDALDQLTHWGYVDDFKLALQILDQYTRLKPSGRLVITKKMYQRGLDSETITTALNEFTRAEEYRLALSIAEKWLCIKPQAKEDDEELALSRHLNRKGFEHTIITRVLEDLGSESAWS